MRGGDHQIMDGEIGELIMTNMSYFMAIGMVWSSSCTYCISSMVFLQEADVEGWPILVSVGVHVMILHYAWH